MNALVAKFVSPYLKAHGAGLVAAVALLIRDLFALKTGQTLSSGEWEAIAGAYVGGGVVVHALPNTPVANPVDPADVAAVLNVQLPDDGSVSEV